MTLNVRADLYKNILRKHMGWHDNRDHSSGVLTAVLAADIQLLNGVSSETLALYAESAFSLLWSLALGFFFSWPIAVCFLLTMPLLMIGAGL